MTRLAELPDQVRVLPTHVGGSFCAARAGGEPVTSIGRERAGNPLLLAPGEDAFVALALEQHPYPAYFERMRSLNRVGAPLLGRRLLVPPRLRLDAFEERRARGAAVLDVRSPESFAEAHISSSYATGVEGGLSSWVGWLLPPDRPLLLVAHKRRQVDESVRQLARIGYDKLVGVLDGGIDTWQDAGRPVVAYPRLPAAELARRLRSGEPLTVVDVRERHEWFAGHVPGSLNVPVHDIPLEAASLPRGSALVVHCGHVYRGTLGASLLEQAGFGALVVRSGGRLRRNSSRSTW